MSLPTFTLEASFPDAPLTAAGRTWTDLSGDMESMSVTRGRQTEDDQAQTGRLAAVLKDEVRAYDPNNTAGPYYPNVLPMKAVRSVATLDGTSYPVFFGWVDIQDGWTRDEGEAAFSKVHLPCNDGFDLLNNARIVTLPRPATAGFVFPAQTTNQRISQALGNASGGCDPMYPTAMRAINAGFQNMSTYVSPATDSPLSVIRTAEQTEPGFFYFDAGGFATFQNRYARLSATSLATFCDRANSGAGILIDSYTTRRTRLYNDVLVTASGGVPQEAQDSTSIDAFVRRQVNYSTGHATDADALGMAQFLLAQSKDSYEVLESLTLVPGTDSPTWVQCLQRELNDRITIIRTPPGGGASITEDYFIEAISLAWGPGPDASVTWRLSRVDSVAFWLLGDATFGILGVSTKFGF